MSKKPNVIKSKFYQAYLVTENKYIHEIKFKEYKTIESYYMSKQKCWEIIKSLYNNNDLIELSKPYNNRFYKFTPEYWEIHEFDANITGKYNVKENVKIIEVGFKKV